MARSTRRVCRDCGFYLPLAGSLGSMFGVCANELSADGHVVDVRVRLRRAFGHPGAGRTPARRCSTRTTTACSTSTEPAES